MLFSDATQFRVFSDLSSELWCLDSQRPVEKDFHLVSFTFSKQGNKKKPGINDLHADIPEAG